MRNLLYLEKKLFSTLYNKTKWLQTKIKINLKGIDIVA